jgi:hypothetical protein
VALHFADDEGAGLEVHAVSSPEKKGQGNFEG